MSRGSFRKAALAGCALVLLTAAPAAALDIPSRGPDLLLVRPAPVAFDSGGRAVVHAHVVNDGDAPTTAPFTLVLQLPPGVFVSGPFSPSSCQPQPFGHTVSCAFPAGLRPGRTDSADIPVFIDQGLAPGELSGELRLDPTGGSPTRDNPAPVRLIVC